MKARIPNQGDNRAAMMKKLQDMQDEMGRVQEEIEQTEFSATSGGGAVTARVNGAHEVLGLELKPEIVDPEDVEILSDMIVAAVNEAMRKAQQTMDSEMGKLTGGLNMPGIPGLGL